VAQIVEYVAYFMAKLEWHRSVGHRVQLVCHAWRSNSITCPHHGGICEE